MPVNGVTIPPLLPWQINKPDGSATDGSASTAVITPTLTAGKRVDCVFTGQAANGSCQWDWGDGSGPNGYQASTDNTAGHTYASFGTYTIRCSNGKASGSVVVNVVAAREGEEAKTEGKKKKGLFGHGSDE